MILKPIFEKLFKIREEANRQREQNKRPGADDGYDPYEKPFLDHLEDLRKTIGKMLVILMVATICAFAFNKQIFNFALMPLSLDLLGLWDGPPLREFVNFLTLSPQEILMLSIKVAFFAGMIASFPLLVYLAGEFILPGLKQQEKKYIIPGVGAGFLLFLTGASFAFFLAAPIALNFFYEFQLERVPMLNPAFAPGEGAQTLSVDELIAGGADALEATPGETVIADKPAIDPALKGQVVTILRGLLATPQDSELSITWDVARERFIFSNTPVQMISYRIGDYINFVTRLTLVFGLSFQLPVVVVILVKLRLLTARVMRGTRAYAWVIMLVASAIFTPPDIFTLALLAGPLIILYEICIWIASAMEFRRAKAEKEEEETEAAARETRLARLYETPADDLSEEEKKELHQHEVDQYEAEHADLYEEDSAHIEHDPHGHGPGHDYDAEHDASWHDEHHDEHGNYIGDDHHHGEEKHEPIKDWPDNPEDIEHGTGDSAVDDSKTESTGEEATTGQSDDFDDDEICEPDGPVVNLNSATEDELQSLPRIGPAMAKRIIENRPYHSFDDVTKVPGLGEETLYAIMERLSIDEPEEDEEVESEDQDKFEP